MDGNRTVWVRRDLKHHLATTQCRGDRGTLHLGCSDPHLTLPWTFPGIGHPQLLWATCSSVSPSSLWRIWRHARYFFMVWPHPHQANSHHIVSLQAQHHPHTSSRAWCVARVLLTTTSNACGTQLAKDACACPVAAAACGHQTGPLGDACQIEQQELVCSNSSIKQPSTLTCTPDPANTRGFLRRWQQELHWLLWLGPGKASPEHSLSQEQPRDRGC